MSDIITGSCGSTYTGGRGMMVPNALRWMVIGPAAVLSVSGAAAQLAGVSRPARVSRPSAVAPSVRLDIIGGLFTRATANPSLTNPGGSTMIQGPPAGLPTSRNRFRYVFSPRRRYGIKPPAGLPPALRFVPTGMVTLKIPETLDSRLFRQADVELRSITGFDTATSLEIPFGFSMLEAPERTGVPGRVPDASQSAFDLFFDLRPAARNKPARPAAGPPVDWVHGVEQAHQARLDALGKQATWLFRQAMAASGDERPKLLSEAVDALRRWRELDAHNPTPCLLLAHAALARSQALSAVLYLTDALRRDARLFEQPPDLTDYFPKPQVLRELLQTYLLGGIEGPDTAEWWALRAYCAWMLDDRGRLREALDQMTDKPREILSQEAVRLYRNTLEASLARTAARTSPADNEAR